MLREGHVGAALALYAPLGFVALVAGFQELAFIGAGVAVALAMLPDQDIRVPLIKHRGITHTVWFAAVVSLLLAAGGVMYGLGHGLVSGIGVGLFAALVGMVTVGSHILADALTPMGVKPFAPYRSTSYSYNVARATNPIANYLLLGLGFAVVLVALYLATLLTG